MINENVSFRTVEYMHRLIAELDEVNTQLRLEAESIAADERAKIVAWLRRCTPWPDAKGDCLRKPFDHRCQFTCANRIEAGEHLK
jgi:hypothetical protein